MISRVMTPRPGARSDAVAPQLQPALAARDHRRRERRGARRGPRERAAADEVRVDGRQRRAAGQDRDQARLVAARHEDAGRPLDRVEVRRQAGILPRHDRAAETPRPRRSSGRRPGRRAPAPPGPPRPSGGSRSAPPLRRLPPRSAGECRASRTFLRRRRRPGSSRAGGSSGGTSSSGRQTTRRARFRQPRAALQRSHVRALVQLPHHHAAEAVALRADGRTCAWWRSVQGGRSHRPMRGLTSRICSASSARRARSLPARCSRGASSTCGGGSGGRPTR